MIILFGEYSYALIAFLISRCCLKQNLIDIAIKEKWIKNLIHKISLILLSCRLTGGIPSYIFQSVKLMSSKLDSFQIIFSVFFLSLPNTLHIQYLNCRFPKIKKCWISYGEFPDPPPTRLTYVIFYLLWLSFFLFVIPYWHFKMRENHEWYHFWGNEYVCVSFLCISVCWYKIFLLQANIEFKGESSTGCVAEPREKI